MNMTTATELRTEASKHFQAAQDSFDRCDTDGFLSQWASGLSGRLASTKADLLDAGGKSEFWGLFTLDGQRVRAKLIDTKHGTCWALCDENDKFRQDRKPFVPFSNPHADAWR